MYHLDTTFLIDFLRKRIDLDDRLKTILKNGPLISSFSVFELYHGIYNLKYKDSEFNFEKRKNEIENLVKNFRIINFDKNAAIKTAEILNYLEMHGTIIDIIDIMIAATAIVNNCTIIITRNKNHYERIPGIQIISYNVKK